MSLLIEIRAAEGGDDAKALMEVQASIYLNYAKRTGLKTSVDAGKG